MIFRTTVGDKAILAGHIPYTAALSVGELKIKSGGEVKRAAHTPGVVTTDGKNTTILCEALEWADEIDVERAEKAKMRAEEVIRIAESKKEVDHAEMRLKRAVNRISVSERNR